MRSVKISQTSLIEKRAIEVSKRLFDDGQTRKASEVLNSHASSYAHLYDPSDEFRELKSKILEFRIKEGEERLTKMFYDLEYGMSPESVRRIINEDPDRYGIESTHSRNGRLIPHKAKSLEPESFSSLIKSIHSRNGRLIPHKAKSLEPESFSSLITRGGKWTNDLKYDLVLEFYEDGLYYLGLWLSNRDSRFIEELREIMNSRHKDLCEEESHVIKPKNTNPLFGDPYKRRDYWYSWDWRDRVTELNKPPTSEYTSISISRTEYEQPDLIIEDRNVRSSIVNKFEDEEKKSRLELENKKEIERQNAFNEAKKKL
jgi:hypothetical protein